jgi:hypothetical protein
MKRFAMAITMSCVLSVSTLAGEVPSVGITAQPPDETTPTTSAPAPGEVPTVGLSQQMSEAAFDLFQLVLGGIL